MNTIEKIAKLNVSDEIKKALHVALVDGTELCTIEPCGRCSNCPVITACKDEAHPKSKREAAWDFLLKEKGISYQIKTEKEFEEEFGGDWRSHGCWSDNGPEAMDKYLGRSITNVQVADVMKNGYNSIGYSLFDATYSIMPCHITIDLDNMLSAQGTDATGPKKFDDGGYTSPKMPPVATGKSDILSEGFDKPECDLIIQHHSEMIDQSKKPTALDTQVGGNHYKDMPIQPIEFCFKNNLNNLQSNIVKYVVRYPFKNGLEDLKKARHYLDYLIEEMEK